MDDSTWRAERIEDRFDQMSQRLDRIEADIPGRFESLLQQKILMWMTGAIELGAFALVILVLVGAV